MSIENSLERKEKISENGWQNIGICYDYAIDNIPQKYHSVFLRIVRYSFGYGDMFTNRITVDEFAKIIGISKPTFITHVKYLSDSKHVKINVYSGYIVDGGSKPNSYSPCFPKGYGKIWLKKKHKKEENDKTNSVLSSKAFN